MHTENKNDRIGRGRQEFLFIVTALALTACPLTLPAENVTLAWDSNPDNNAADVAGYMLYYGTDGVNFPGHLDAGTNTSITVSNLSPGTVAYFEVKAYNYYDSKSPPSTQVEYFVTNNQSGSTNIVDSVVATTLVTNSGNGFALLIGGDGTVSPNRSAVIYQTGKTFTLTATARKGSVFANWVSNGIVVASTPRYTFTVAPNLVLLADFIPNPFAPVVATYHGLFSVTNDASQDNCGSFVATVTASGAFSARLSLGSASYSFSSAFSAAGAALKSIPRPGASPLTVQLELDLTTNGPMTGTISNENWTANLVADPAVFSRTNPAPLAGKYTLLLPGSTNASALPGGNGFAALSVSPLGNITLSGTLGDGTALSGSSVLSAQGLWPLYVSLYGGKGSIIGWLSLTNASSNDVSGQAGWFKPSQAAAKLYPAGFTNSLALSGSLYTNALPNLGLSSGTLALTLTNGSLSQVLSNQLSLAANDIATDPDNNKNKLIFKSASGLFKGSVIDPQSGLPIAVSGILLQNQNAGAGFFPGSSQSGSALLSPTP